MRILLIGVFTPPYEEENLHSLALLDLLNRNGHDCSAIDISERLSPGKEVVTIRNYVDYVLKLVRHGWRRDVVHFLTKGYTRPGLMKLMTAVLVGKLLGAKLVITLHSEMFSILGRLRSKITGEPLLLLCFFLASRVICEGRDTYEMIASKYRLKNKYILVPSVIEIPDDISQYELSILKPLQGKERVLLLVNVTYPSFLFEVFQELTTRHLGLEVGVAIALPENSSSQLLRERLAGLARGFSENMIFLDQGDRRLMSLVYARADQVMRPASCDGVMLFDNNAFMIRQAARQHRLVHFPFSLCLVKEGEASPWCASVAKEILIRKPARTPLLEINDFHKTISEIYFQ